MQERNTRKDNWGHTEHERKLWLEEEDDRNADKRIDTMRMKYKKWKVRNLMENNVLYSTQGQARDKSTEAGCSRVTPGEDQEIWDQSDTVHEDTIVLIGDTLKRKDDTEYRNTNKNAQKHKLVILVMRGTVQRLGPRGTSWHHEERTDGRQLLDPIDL